MDQHVQTLVLNKDHLRSHHGHQADTSDSSTIKEYSVITVEYTELDTTSDMCHYQS